MISKLNSHYSFENPASVHDEEALTALQLAGRTTAKINEVVDAQNKLQTDTENHLTAQDQTIEQRMTAQDNAIEKMNNVTMPAKVTSEIKKHIDNGTFADEIDRYAGNLEQRVDNLIGMFPEGSTSMDAEVVDGRLGANGKTYANIGTAIREQTSVRGRAVTDILYQHSENLYDPYSVTDDNVIDGYLVDGGVLSDNETYNTQYKHSPLLPIDGGKTYGLFLAPKYGVANNPCPYAGWRVHFYDAGGNWIESSTSTTFTTPVNTSFYAFNIDWQAGIRPSVLQTRLVLLENVTTAPDEYIPYYAFMLDDRVKALEAASGTMFYNVNGTTVTVNSHYGENTDLQVVLAQKGGNNLFDFYSFGLIENHDTLVSSSLSSTIFKTTLTDWHAPFVVGAVNNSNGDTPDNIYFTGGNHQTNNDGTGGAATARTLSVKVFADGKRVTGSGRCNNLRIEWVNRVQGYNTSKASGAGREIIEERHVLTFDGVKWTSEAEIEPLEDVVMNTYYGLQISASGATKIRFIGGEKRGTYTFAENPHSGNRIPAGMVCFDDAHKITATIDGCFDLGRRDLAAGVNGAFALSYGKAYFHLIDGSTLNAGDIYSFRGTYEFSPV